MNKVILSGRLTRDPETRYTQGENSLAVTSFSLAVDRFGKDKGADFIRCTAFGKTAESLAKYAKKGTKLVVSGRWQTGSYEKNGAKVYTNDCVLDGWEFAESKQTEAAPELPTSGDFVPVPDDIDEELPFA